jgi:hypothetical protein
VPLLEVIDLVCESALPPDIGVLDDALKALDEALDPLGDAGQVGLVDVGTNDVKDLVVA